MENYHVTLKSSNAKTGPIVVTMTSQDSCPDRCLLKKNGCYADSGPLKIHWKKLDNQGLNLDQLVDKVSGLNPTIIRHNQAGDLPGRSNSLNTKDLNKLVAAFSKHKAFTYTHKLPLRKSLRYKHINNSCNSNFTINISANNLEEAVKYKQIVLDYGFNIPITAIIPHTSTKKSFTYKGLKVITCPATYNNNIKCINCGNGTPLCSRSNREYVIGFPAHGSSYKKVSSISSFEV